MDFYGTHHQQRPQPFLGGRSLAATLVGLFGLPLVQGLLAATLGLIDQQQLRVSPSGLPAIGGQSKQQLAQVVTAGLTGSLVAVWLPVDCSPFSLPPSDLHLEIQGVSAGLPNGLVLASQTIPGSDLPDFGLRRLAFSAPASFSAGEQFAMVLTSTGHCRTSLGSIGDPYLAGSAFARGSPSQTGQYGPWLNCCKFSFPPFAEHDDFVFQTEVAESLITVNTTDDELNSDGDCSLREAIRASNTDSAVDACTAGAGADTINLPAGIYTLTVLGAGENAAATGDLDITGDLTISGAGAGTTIVDGNATDRVFDTPVSPPTTVSISGVNDSQREETLGVRCWRWDQKQRLPDAD